MRYCFITTRIALIKKVGQTLVGKSVEKLEHSSIADGKVKMVHPLWKPVLTVPEEVNLGITTPSSFTPSYIIKQSENTCPHKNF